MDDRESDAVRRAIRSWWITQGPEVDAFEREFAATVGAPHAVAMSSGTAALHCALLAVGVERDDEVITVSHSFIATANAITHCGALPVFVDIDPHTYHIDPALVEDAACVIGSEIHWQDGSAGESQGHSALPLWRGLSRRRTGGW